MQAALANRHPSDAGRPPISGLGMHCGGQRLAVLFSDTPLPDMTYWACMALLSFSLRRMIEAITKKRKLKKQAPTPVHATKKLQS